VGDDAKSGRSQSPPRRPKCAFGYGCPTKNDKSDPCPHWHPSHPPKQAGQAPKTDREVVLGGFFADVSPTGAPVMIAAARVAKAESSKPLVRKVRFGEFAYKVIEPVPAGEYAPSLGELLQHVHVPARMPLAPTLRRRQPQTVEPHPELKEVLLPESRTRRLYHDFSRVSPTAAWLKLSADEKRYHVVQHGSSWIERFNRFLASCLHWKLRITAKMLKQWDQLTRPSAPIGLRDRAPVSVAAVPRAVPAPSVPAAAAAVVSPADGVKQIDLRELEIVSADLLPGVYLIKPGGLFTCFDTGCAMFGMTYKDDAAVIEVRDLKPSECFSAVGVGGSVDIRQIGKKPYQVPVKVVHANPELQEIMRRFVQDAEDAVADAADKLYYHFHVPVYINPTLREGVTLVSCGKLVLEMGMTMHLDRAPGGSYALSPADEVTGVRLQFELQWGGGTGLPFDVLLNAPELQVDMQPADAVERARETWQIVRVLHQRAQEQLAVNLAAREEEAYSLWGSFAGYVDYASPDAAVPISHDFFDGSASACFSAGAAAALACSAAAYAVSVDHPVACMCARSQEAPVESDAELPTIGDCVSFEEACAISWAF
jgi:hypothetical protein